MFLYVFVHFCHISRFFAVFSRHVRNAGHGAHGGDGPRWHGGVPSFDTFAEYTVDEVVSRRMMFSSFPTSKVFRYNRENYEFDQETYQNGCISTSATTSCHILSSE